MSLADMISIVSAFSGTITSETVNNALIERGIKSNSIDALIKNAKALHESAEVAKTMKGGKKTRRRGRTSRSRFQQ